MAVLQDININVHGQPSEKRLQTFLRLSQNENGRMINFRVLGPPLPSNCTATFSGTKPDGNVYSKTGTVTGNFVVIEEDIQMTAVAGVWDAKLDIINGTHNIMTALIRVVVDADVVDPDAIASDSQLQGLVAEAKYYAEHARTDAYGSPLTATTAAEMTDKTRVYVYTGSETGMTAGNWYYWNGSAWVSGGVYNAVAVQTDTTLSVAGKAADGKAAGDAIEELKEDLNSVAVPYNVLDYTKAYDNTGLSSTNGSASSNSSYWVTDFIEIQNEEYIVSNYNIYKICYYDATKTFISAATLNLDFHTIVENAEYARVQFDKSNVEFNTSDLYIVLSSAKNVVDPVRKLKKSPNMFLGLTVDDFEFSTKEKIIGLDSLINVSWEAGTINGTTGVNAAGGNRFRSVGYIPIDAFYCYENSLKLKTRTMAYSESFSFLGGMGTGMGTDYFTKQDILTQYQACKYVRFIFQTDTITDVTDYTKIYGTESYYKAIKAYDFGMGSENSTGFSYSGERIQINKNRLTYSVYDSFTGYGQDAVTYGDYAFLFKADTVIIRRLSTKTNITSIALPVSAHCNSAVFGNKYDESDLFPLIYVNAYNATGVANGVCYVFRVTTGSNGVPNGLTLVQTITIGFASVEPWTDGNDIRPYGNFFVDTVNGYLWAYTLKDSNKATRFFKFSLPNISSSSVTISNADIIEQFDTQYMPYIQGNTFNDGKAYILSGYGTGAYHGMLSVVNLSERAIVTQIDLYNIGLQFEPEFIDIIDGNIVLGKTTAYKFTF